MRIACVTVPLVASFGEAVQHRFRVTGSRWRESVHGSAAQGSAVRSRSVEHVILILEQGAHRARSVGGRLEAVQDRLVVT